MISILNETGTFELSYVGTLDGLMFIGDDSFINRCLNMVINYGIAKPKSFRRLNHNTAYVLTSQIALFKGIKLLLKNEFKLNREYTQITKNETENDFIIDVVYDEDKLESFADSMALEFISNIPRNSKLMNINGFYINNEEYGLGEISTKNFKTQKTTKLV